MKKERRSLVLFVVLALVASTGCGCTSTGGEETESVEAVKVERGSLVTSVTAVGSIQPASEVVLSFEISGRVDEVLVTEGDRVEEGQLLARLNAADIELQVLNAKAALEGAQAQLDQLRTGPRNEEVSAAEGQIAAAEAAVDQSVAQRDQVVAGTRDTEIAAAEAQIVAAKARVTQLQRQMSQTAAQDPTPDVDAAQIEVERAKISLDDTQDEYNKALDRPWEDQSIRDGWAKQLEQDKLNYRAAQTQLDRALNNQRAHGFSLQVLAAQIDEANASQAAAEAQLAQAQISREPQLRAAEAAVAAARAQVEIAKAQLAQLLAGTSDAQIAVAQASVDQAQVALDSVRLTLGRAELRAPFAGVVGSVSADQGASAGPQVPAITLVNDTRFSIESDVDEADIGWLDVGQDVKITLDAFPGRGLTGRVAAILPSASQDVGIVSYRVLIAIDQTDLPLRGGMTADRDRQRPAG